MHRDLPGGGVYDCTTYGAWGQTSWFLLANSMFPPHKTSKTAGSAEQNRVECGGFWVILPLLCVSNPQAQIQDSMWYWKTKELV
jgi:hypothetical protein